MGAINIRSKILKFNQTSFYLFVDVEQKKPSFEIHHNQSKMRDGGYDEKSLKVASKKQRSSKIESETRRWSEINVGASKYKVWKVGQSEEHAISLNDAISQNLPVKSEKN
ncbi:hypothetical protein PVL29_003786 [Vitis rotundifolia]|uniref:Uncharacterized protein n=1 Tax=Vitis rotundifolia TaxID=103349 RepID=A0AA39AGI8_VITRO|nr:hypothetical protein PVL29_003786 [Vitis rotundifolia]